MSLQVSSERGSYILAVLVATAVFGVVFAASGAAASELVITGSAVEDDESIVGATEEHTVTLNVSNVNVAEGAATVELDVTDWSEAVVAEPTTNDIDIDSGGTVVSGPELSDGLITFQINDTAAETIDIDISIDIEFTHPTSPSSENESYDVTVAVSDTDGSETARNEIHLQNEELEAFITTSEDDIENFGDNTEASFLIQTNREDARNLTVRTDGLGMGELRDLFVGDVDVEPNTDSAVVIRNVTRNEPISLSFDGVPQGTYAFNVTTIDTGVSATTDGVSVLEPQVDAEFESDVFETQAGEYAHIELSLEETDEAYVLVGADRSSEQYGLNNYFDLLYVQGDSEFLVNTRLLGTNVSSSDVYLSDGSVISYQHSSGDHPAFENVTFEDEAGEPVAEDMAEFREEIGISELPRPLQPDRYRLVAGADDSIVLRDDGIPDVERPLARSNLLLTQPGFENVTLHVAPRASANDIGETDDLEDIGSIDDFSQLGTLDELRESTTRRDNVAVGDRLVVEVQGSGLYGLLSWLEDDIGLSSSIGSGPEVLEALLARPEGVVLDIEHTNPGTNEPRNELALGSATDGNIYLVPENADSDDPTVIDRYYLVIDTSRAEPFDNQPSADDEFELEFGYTAAGSRTIFDGGTSTHVPYFQDRASNRFPYFEDGASNDTRNRTFSIEEPTVQYDRTDVSDRPIVTNGTNATISGETNVAPGTDGTIQLIAENRTPPTRITIEDVKIEADGSFNVSHDLSPLRAGTGVELEFYRQGEILDKRPAVVITDNEPLPAFEITELTNETTIPRGASLRDIRTTVLNNGTVGDTQPVRLDIDGETVDQRTLDLDARGAATYSYSGVQIDRPPGTYNYTLVTNDDEATGQLTIEGDEPNSSDEDTAEETDEEGETTDETAPSESDDATGESDESDSTDTTDSDDNTDEEDEGQQEGLAGLLNAVPVGSRHAIGGAAVVGAAHVLGYWT